MTDSNYINGLTIMKMELIICTWRNSLFEENICHHHCFVLTWIYPSGRCTQRGYGDGLQKRNLSLSVPIYWPIYYLLNGAHLLLFIANSWWIFSEECTLRQLWLTRSVETSHDQLIFLAFQWYWIHWIIHKARKLTWVFKITNSQY